MSGESTPSQAAIKKRARELADEIRSRAPYTPAQLHELARLVAQLGSHRP